MKKPLTLLWSLIVVVLLSILFVRLGLWQLHKGQERLERGAALAQREAQPPVPLAELTAPGDFQKVLLSGSFDADHQLVVDNVVFREQAGAAIITPMVTIGTSPAAPAGTRWLINRGWLPRTYGNGARQVIVPPPVPTGLVTVTGLLQRPVTGLLLGENAAGWPKAVQWVDLDLYRSLYPVAPWIVLQEDPPAGLTYVRPQPDEGGAQNINYAYQWFGFAIAAVAIWLFFALRAVQSWRHRK